jgi:hypothetical protein
LELGVTNTSRKMDNTCLETIKEDYSNSPNMILTDGAAIAGAAISGLVADWPMIIDFFYYSMKAFSFVSLMQNRIV